MPNYISDFISDEFNNVAKLDENQNIGIAGFNLIAAIRQGYVRGSSVPFSVLEDGSLAADHVISNPLAVEIEGSVSQVYYQPTNLQEVYIRGLAEIGNIDRYLPDYTRQQINAINGLVVDAANVVRKVDGYINSGEQLYNIFFSNSSGKSIPEKFIDLMDALQDTKQKIKIEMPYRIFENMIITSFQVINPAEYINALEFRLTAIQISYSKTYYTDISRYYKKPSAAVNDQTTDNNDKGINKTKEVPISALSSGANFLQQTFGG